MCLCGNLGLLKESGQYSTLAPYIFHVNVHRKLVYVICEKK